MRGVKQYGVKRGFTLIELLVVVAIIGILASVALASLSGARKKAAYTARIQAVKAVKSALLMYELNNGSFPLSPGGSVNLGYGISTISSALAPYMDISKLPSNSDLSYVVGSGQQTYGLRVTLEDGSYCLTGYGHEGIGWWGLNSNLCSF